jgi:hypothetical protein
MALNRATDTVRDGTHEAGERSRRREKRGLGPFTGGQLTAIIVTFAVLLLIPIGAWAVTGSNVFVTDASTGSTAKVDASGSLQTRVKGSVPLSAPTASAIHSPLLSPTTCASDPCSEVIAPPAGKALIVTSIHVSAWSVPSPGPGERVLFQRSVDGSCNAASLNVVYDVAHPGGVGDTVLTYSPGLTVPAGSALCARTSDAALSVDLSAFCYAVAPGAVPPS